MNSEQLDEIEKRWAGYLEKNEVERRFLFDRWWDKRDFWDMTKALREAWEARDAAGHSAAELMKLLIKAEQERDEARADRDDALAILARVAKQLGVAADALAEDSSLAVRERDKLLSENTRMRVTMHFLREKAGYFRSDLEAAGQLSPRTSTFRQLVRDKEWITDGRESVTYCLWCHRTPRQGHATSCEMFGAAGFIEPAPEEVT